MTTTKMDSSATQWQRLVEAHQSYAVAFRDFFGEGIDRVAILRDALRGPSRGTALRVAPSLSQAERLRLFPEWVFLASFAHGAIQIPRDMILSLPRDWVLGNLAREVEPYLRDGTDDEYRRFLELYELLDPSMALALAKTAAAHNDPDIQDAGRDFVARLGESHRNGVVATPHGAAIA